MAAPATEKPPSSSPLPVTEAIWKTALADAPELVPGPRRWLILSPHPDDETLGAGGLIARAARRGDPMTIVLATMGEAAKVDLPMLLERRRWEHRAALEALGAEGAELVELGLPDGELAAHEPALTRALSRIATPETTVVAPLETDGHPDHEAAARSCRQVSEALKIEHLEYPIWAWEHLDLERFPLARAVRLELRPEEQAAKARAIACYQSQIAPLRGRPVVPPEVLVRFARTFEVFVR